jgi:hypothetical protein
MDELKGKVVLEDEPPKINEDGEEEEDEEELEKDDIGEAVSYTKLMSHINQIHPRDSNADKFGMCSYLG